MTDIKERFQKALDEWERAYQAAKEAADKARKVLEELRQA